MALELRQHLKLTQQLVMTPQLQQAIKLLQFSRVELIESINQELEANPVLDEGPSEESPQTEEPRAAGSDRAEGSSWDENQLPTLASSDLEKTPWEEKAVQEMEWRDYWDEDRKAVLPAYSFEAKDAPNYENLLTNSTDLTEHLMWQLQMTRLTETERNIGGLMIGNLAADGYLKVSVEEIAGEVGCEIADAEKVLRQIQMFDPVGVAARDLRECLLIQIDYLGVKDPLVRELVSEHLHDLERHNYQVMVKATGRPVEEIAQAIEIITNLEPRPGRSFASENIHYIVPDIYVYKVDESFVVVLNDEGIPRLRVSNYYRDALNKSAASDSAREFIQDKLKSALWLIRSIHQRQKTIYKVTKSIVKFQTDFLDKGIAYLKPLILRDVAEDVEMHESTISRVTTNKYVHTPQGIFELKFFFSAGLRRNKGADVATQSVKERIRQLIQAEDQTHPYSDKQLVEILGKDDIRIARRTVAKYRDILGILPSSRRKRPVMK
jgi:RNA polymerase sigma-54 factor